MPPEHPIAEDRDWLLDQLATLLHRAGWATFVLAPLIEPNDEFFPDRYEHGPAGARLVAQRLLHHAGLHEVVAHVSDERAQHDEDQARRLLKRTEIHTSLEGSSLRLAVRALGAPEDVVLVLAHGVARAYRELHGLDRPAAHSYRAAPPSSDEDELLAAQLATIASVYVGFGILAANGAHRYRVAALGVGRSVRVERQHHSIGELDATAVSFVLAVQLVVRGADDEAIARVRSMLAPNQSSDVRAWIDELAPEREALRARLGVPRSERDWPAPREIDRTPLATPDPEVAEPEEAPPPRRRNEDQRVFRVRGDQTQPYAVRGAGVGLVATIALALLDAGALSAIGLLCGTAIGIAIGMGRREDRCSDPRCEEVLPRAATECSRCGGTIAGVIGHSSERLAAEEALDARRRRTRRRR